MITQHDWVGVAAPFNPPKGTVTLNGVTPVPVAVPTLLAGAIVLFAIQTVGGIAGVVTLTSVTPGVGFSLLTVALGTSVVGWTVLNP